MPHSVPGLMSPGIIPPTGRIARNTLANRLPSFA
nr:PREDICTED: dachshund homolog 1-like [Struthio camelus australis]